jgi:hypothetical protein
MYEGVSHSEACPLYDLERSKSYSGMSYAWGLSPL